MCHTDQYGNEINCFSVTPVIWAVISVVILVMVLSLARYRRNRIIRQNNLSFINNPNPRGRYPGPQNPNNVAVNNGYQTPYGARKPFFGSPRWPLFVPPPQGATPQPPLNPPSTDANVVGLGPTPEHSHAPPPAPSSPAPIVMPTPKTPNTPYDPTNVPQYPPPSYSIV